MNITEKILSAKAGHEVTPGEIIEIPVDLAMSHDGTSPPAIKTFEKIADKVWDSEKIAIIFGGMSTEHDVSIVSGLSVIKHLNKNNYEINPIYIDKNGEWFLYNKNINEIDIPRIGEVLTDLEKLENPVSLLKKMDKVFPVLHGLYGEDGTIQGMLEMFKIPYVGCKVLASSICMDKIYTKMIFEKAGINQAKYVYVKRIPRSLNQIDEENGSNSILIII